MSRGRGVSRLIGARGAYNGSTTQSYSTEFDATESPISEGSNWVNGLAVGGDWNNVQTAAGVAHGATTITGFHDCLAHLSGSWPSNQFARGVVHRTPGYSPGVAHEIELLLRFAITSGNARGYELLWTEPGEICIVRWNGAYGSYTALMANLNVGPAVDGDRVLFTADGSTLTAYINGVQKAQVTDSTYSDGAPGVGFWPQAGTTLLSYGWKGFQAGGL